MVEDLTYKQHVAAATISGNLFDGIGAGPVGTAVGGEYRKEIGDVTHGDIPNYTDYAFTYGLDYGGSIEVIEGFGELNVPVMANSPFFELLEVNGAVRWTKNTAKNAYTNEYKSTEAVSYKLSAYLGNRRRRAACAVRARAISVRRASANCSCAMCRAKKVHRSASSTTRGYATIGNDDPTPILAGGSFALAPEKADTTTAGVVFRPSNSFPGLSLSVDWYQIEVRPTRWARSAGSGSSICATGSICFCERLTFGITDQDITFIDARQVNISNADRSGLRFRSRLHAAPVRHLDSLGGSLNLRLLANHQYDLKNQFDPSAPIVDFAGQTGPVLVRRQFQLRPGMGAQRPSSAYDSGPFNATLSVRRISEGIYNVERKGPEDEGYAGRA